MVEIVRLNNVRLSFTNIKPTLKEQYEELGRIKEPFTLNLQVKDNQPAQAFIRAAQKAQDDAMREHIEKVFRDNMGYPLPGFDLTPQGAGMDSLDELQMVIAMAELCGIEDDRKLGEDLQGKTFREISHILQTERYKDGFNEKD